MRYVLLYHFVGHSFFGLIAFRSFSNIIKWNFSLTLAKLNFYVDMSVWLFVGKQYNRFDSCFSFQGKFFHFLTINRHRKIEYDLLYPASVFPFLREHLNSLDKGLHKLLLLRFRCGMVDFIKCQQQAIDIVSGNLLLLDAADLTLQFANLNFDFLYGVILLIIIS